MAKTQTILVVDDDRNILMVVEARLASGGYAVRTAASGEEALRILAKEPVDLILTDVRMPGMSGHDLLERVLKDHPGLPVIVLTAHGSIPDSVEAIKSGAVDYLTKPFEGKELLAKVTTYLKAGRPVPAPQPRLTDEAAEYPAIAARLWGGKSPSMQKLFNLISRIAPTNVNVLVTGESGTGKERVARILHELSPRAAGPFAIVDCGSTPAGLLESELFGHVKGSFTHAVRDKKGLIEEADGGTLFLDEVGNISSEMQTRLLRFLQEQTIRRIGDTRELRVDCRVVAATNADLAAMVRDSSFREDLYFRLKVMTLTIPPLRERVDDIPILVEKFLATFAEPGQEPMTVNPEAMRRMLDYPWPGNVRELKHVIEAGVVLCHGGVLKLEDLQLEPGSDTPAALRDAMSLDESERLAILRALEEVGWVMKDAAELLGISRRSIHYKVKKYGIRVPARSSR